ncbi:MAG: hypothetical protein EBR01_09980 [Proteobacteria bacterium]|nr:hypothetical protein [Pseudomonadota bacterium]
MWRILRQLLVFGCFILLVFLVFSSRPTSLFEPPLFNPARGFGVAVLLFFGFRYLIALHLAGVFCNFYFLNHSLLFSLIFATTTIITISLLILLTKRFCKQRNPALNPRDWAIFLGLFIPFTSTLRFLLDNIILLSIGTKLTTVWTKNYIDWMLVDLLGVILVFPFFMELFEFLPKQRKIKEISKNIIPALVGNIMGSFVFFNPHFDKILLPDYLTFYIAVLGMLGLAYFVSPLPLTLSVLFQGFWAAWGRDGAILANHASPSQSIWALRVFLFVVGIFSPILSNLFRAGSEDNFKKSFDLVNSALDPSNTENEIIRVASKSEAVGVAVFDLNRRLLHLNEKFAAITGEPVESQIGKTSEERLGPNAGHVKKIFDKVHETGRPVWNYPVSFRAWKGIHEHNILANYMPVFSKRGTVVGIIVVTTDVPKNHKLGPSLQNEEFAIALSHDVQEPLRNISQAIKILKEKYSSSSDFEIKTFIESALDASSRAQSMVKSSIDLARLGHDNLSLAPIHMEGLVNEVLVQFKSELSQIGGTMTVSPLPQVMGDRYLLERLIQNLVSNAIKYRSEKPLEINLCSEKNGKLYQFCLSDNGIGFPPSEKERVFVPFQRLHTDREISGHGVGLSSSRKIISLHGGKMWAESQENHGAQFYFTLPVA